VSSVTEAAKYYHTVGELREALAGLDADLPIVMAKDGEGNDFSPLAVWETNHRYEPTTTWSGEIYPTPESLTEVNEDPDEYDTRDASDADAVKALVLWPIN